MTMGTVLVRGMGSEVRMRGIFGRGMGSRMKMRKGRVLGRKTECVWLKKEAPRSMSITK